MAQPRLLQQMQMLMGAWRQDDPPRQAKDDDDDGQVPSAAEDTRRLQQMAMNCDTAQAVLKLYTGTTGPYKPLLSQLHEYFGSTVDAMTAALTEARTEAAVLRTKMAATPVLRIAADDQQQQPPGTASTAAASDEGGDVADIHALSSARFAELSVVKGDRCDYAFSRVEHAERRMQDVVSTSRQRQQAADARIKELEVDVEALEQQLKEQVQKVRRLAKDPESERLVSKYDLDRERRILTLELELRAEKQRVEQLEEQMEETNKRTGDLLQLNAKYARQAMELVTRVRVYAEQNDKFATLLSLQHDEKAQTDRENELLRRELVNMNQFHQLRENLEGDTGSEAHTVSLRTIRHGRGANPTVPRHLHFTGLMNRVPMVREAAEALVSDILTQRQAPSFNKMELTQFVHHYMTRRHGDNALSWSYALDDATRLNDTDVNVHLFGLVSRREIPEAVYREIATDQRMFIAGCEQLDKLQHGHETMTVPIPHAVGLLVEMYPAYSDGAIRKMMEHLQANLASNGHVHYRMLFPNLEREELVHAADTGALSHAETRKENRFSQAFKELILDDVAVTLQLLEDELMKLAEDTVAFGQMDALVSRVFPIRMAAFEVRAMVRHAWQELIMAATTPPGGNRDTSTPAGGTGGKTRRLRRSQLVSLLRTKTPMRRGVYRTETSAALEARLQPHLQLAAGKGDAGRLVLASLCKVEYREVVQSLVIRRRSYMTDEDVRAGRVRLVTGSDDDSGGEDELPVDPGAEEVAVTGTSAPPAVVAGSAAPGGNSGEPTTAPP